MATAAKTDVPEIVGSIILLPVDEIAFGDRVRPIDEVWAATLGRIMAAEGQKTPIEVCRLPGRKHWQLVAGAHRLDGARSAGMAYIRAIEVNNDAIERKVREISENLWRKGLDPLDRAAFIAQMHELLRARAGITPDQSPQSIAANARWQKAVKGEALDATAMIADAYSIDAQIGERLGLSERTIRNDLTLYRRLSAAEAFELRQADHPILRNGAQLLALSKLEASDRRETISLLVRGTVKTVSEAIALRSQKAKPSPESKNLSAFVGAFARMGLAEKKGALAQLATMLTPALVEALAESIDLPRRSAPIAGPEVENALRISQRLLGNLIEGALPVSDEMIEAAHDACEQALHRCGPAISNELPEMQA